MLHENKCGAPWGGLRAGRAGGGQRVVLRDPHQGLIYEVGGGRGGVEGHLLNCLIASP